MNKNGFSLVEIMVVVIILGVLVAMGLTRYQKTIEITRERDACVKLIAIHAANEIYKGRANEYLPGTNLDLEAINSGLSLNILADDLIFDYDRLSSSTYEATAEFQRGGTTLFKVRIDETAITEIFSSLEPSVITEDYWDDLLMSTEAEAMCGCTPTNPCCSYGKCPTLKDCC